MSFPFQNRQTIMMWTNAARKQGIAIEQQVMNGDGSSDVFRGCTHKLNCIPGRNMLKNDA